MLSSILVIICTITLFIIAYKLEEANPNNNGNVVAIGAVIILLSIYIVVQIYETKSIREESYKEAQIDALNGNYKYGKTIENNNTIYYELGATK